MDRLLWKMLALFSASILLLGADFVVAQPSDPVAKVTKHIETAKTSANANTRDLAAMELPYVTLEMNRADIDDQLVDNLASLLGNEDKVLVHYSALALGNLGPLAKRAVPSLQTALEEFKRRSENRVKREGVVLIQGIYEGDGICRALDKIGAPEPSNCFNGGYRY